MNKIIILVLPQLFAFFPPRIYTDGDTNTININKPMLSGDLESR